jgi:hypothetical protein
MIMTTPPPPPSTGPLPSYSNWSNRREILRKEQQAAEDLAKAVDEYVELCNADFEGCRVRPGIERLDSCWDRIAAARMGVMQAQWMWVNVMRQ